MHRRTGAMPFTELNTISLDGDSSRPLYRRLYFAFREAILAGRLPPGLKLPSSRKLSEMLAISRNTAVTAYQQLRAEGFIEAAAGSGNYVCEHLPDTPICAPAIETDDAVRAELSTRGRGIANLAQRGPRDKFLPFAAGIPDFGALPLETWARIVSRNWRQASRRMLDYGDPAGYPPLRRAIAGYLSSCRALNCRAEQVLVVSGAQQALDLTFRMLLDPGDHVWLEDPCYRGTLGALKAAGGKPVSIPLDGEGLMIERALKMKPDARIAAVTPSHQFPTGVTMSLPRRLALLAWAREQNAWIIEDDYDSEYRYTGRPLAALQGMDKDGRVIYLGTFSKVLFPSLRIGYLVVPEHLVEAMCTARAFVDSHPPVVVQAALEEFIREGHFASHIRRTRELYAQRQKVFVEELRTHLGDLLPIHPSDAGMHQAVLLPPGKDDVALVAQLRNAGIAARALSTYYLGPEKASGLILGYAAFDESQIKEAVPKLAEVINAFW